MADRTPEADRPARPLVGYRDTGAEPHRFTRAASTRAWVILAMLWSATSAGR